MGVNMKKLDQTFLALADPTRRAILQRLRRKEARVTELAEPFPISLNSVSKHIRILERAKLVTRRKVGREHYLRFCPDPLEPALRWLGKQTSFSKAVMVPVDAPTDKRGRR
jgi:DNA-binding transcriptional ArsR family regulator